MHWRAKTWLHGSRGQDLSMLSFSPDFILLHCSREDLNVGLSLAQSPELHSERLREHTYLVHWTEPTSSIPSFSVSGPPNATGQGGEVW